MPCSILNLNVQDILGSRVENIQGTLKKRKVNKDGILMGQEVINNLDNNANSNLPDYDYVKNQIKSGEGCNIAGTFQVNKVISK